MTTEIVNEKSADMEYRQFQRETERRYREYISPSLSRLVKFSGYGVPEMGSQGVFVHTADGSSFLDCAGGYGVFSLGHRHPRIISAVMDQLEKIPLSAKVFYNPIMAELAERLAEISPGRLKYSFFCNSGAEAVEGAVKTARLKTGRVKVVTTSDAFHGKTMGALSVSGRELFKKPFYPLLSGVETVPFGDSNAMEKAVDSDTACVIVEPVQGEGGINLPPAGYLQDIRRICDENGALFIADEVQTGLGRTGRMFAVEHWGVEPDLMCLAKALGGGVMPLGAFMGTAEVWDAFRENPLIHTTTFGGGELACRAGLETLRVIEDEKLIENSEAMGKRLMAGLELIRKEYPGIVHQVRGMGLMIGVELNEEKFGGSIIMEMAKRKVIGVYTLNKPRVIRFEPPLVIKESEVDTCVNVFRESVIETGKRFGE